MYMHSWKSSNKFHPCNPPHQNWESLEPLGICDCQCGCLGSFLCLVFLWGQVLAFSMVAEVCRPEKLLSSSSVREEAHRWWWKSGVGVGGKMCHLTREPWRVVSWPLHLFRRAHPYLRAELLQGPSWASTGILRVCEERELPSGLREDHHEQCSFPVSFPCCQLL